ncbi:DegT/DnrJ/EryC1/StrS aminotransferase family protein [Candidatus Pelagibacter sp.]|nr:DegT/DnrJ/EryC1/StrS aminotransferase family protein [Candidatus Pelagibacter sp.]
MQEKSWPNFSKNLISRVGRVLNSGKINYTNGPYGVKFEKTFSKFVGNKYSIAVCNGTAALEVAIKSLKLPKSSEIIVPARSFFSSASSIVNTGYKPVFADVNLYTQNISIKDIKKKISNKTKAIICVHLAGLPCDMQAIKKLANKKKLKIIEDCSQAHGASINNKHVGSFGDISTWSFCNDKIISTLGEGGMISTNKKNIYEFCKKYINHGTNLKNNKDTEKFIYNKDNFGTNLRLTEIQSLSGLEQLKNLKKIQKKREKISKSYFNLISNYNKYFYCYYPSKKIKSAWYRFYFFIKIDIKNYQTLRLKLIKNLRKNNLRCFTGSCPEIYLEKAFKRLNNYKKIKLSNCETLGKTSIALDINHTLEYFKYKNKILILKKVIEQTLQI